METSKIFFLFLLLGLLSNSTFSQPIFPTTDTNLNQNITEIQQVYGSQISISSTDIYNFVFPFVQGTSNSSCPAPEPQIQQLGNGSVTFSWPAISMAVSYGYYYINLDTGVSFSSTTSTPGVSFSGLQGTYLFGFYTICGDGTRSPSSVIIVDIDVIFPENYTADCLCETNDPMRLIKNPGKWGTYVTTPWRIDGRCKVNQYKLRVNGYIEGDFLVPYSSELSFIYQSDLDLPTFWLLPDCDVNALSSAEDPYHVGSGLDPHHYNVIFSEEEAKIYFPNPILPSPLRPTSISLNYCGCAEVPSRSAALSQTESRQITSFSVFPNPGGEQTKLRYQLSEPSTVQISVYDPLGRMVQQIVPATQQEEGTYDIQLDLSRWPKGMYYCQLTTGQLIKTVLLRKE